MTPNASASVVLSLDFELRWGVHDIVGSDLDGYRANLEGVRAAVPTLLKIFGERTLPATWATVGAVACRSWDEYIDRAPPPPTYRDAALTFDRRIADLDPSGALHFAPELVEQIVRTPGQELATHTFSHLFLGEPGVVASDAIADHDATERLFEERFGIRPMSLVYPRNQVAFWPFLKDRGVRAYRGNDRFWFHRLRGDIAMHPVTRTLRLIDGLQPWSSTLPAQTAGEIPSTMFLRLGLPEPLWKLHFAKIQRALRSARPGEVIHLWFHPHNLGADVEGTSGRVADVADVIAEEAAKGRLTGRAMAEAGIHPSLH